MRRTRIAALVLTVTLTASACGSTNDPAPAPTGAPSSSATGAPKGNPPAPSPSASPTPTLPTKLPKFSQGNVEDTVRTIIEMAAAYAVDVPDEDRHPKIKVVEGQESCIPGTVNVGLEKQIDGCYPDENGVVTIKFSPSGLWENVQKRADHGGGQLWTQDLVLQSYMNYLLFREGQRQNLLFATTDAAGEKIQKISFCRQGAVFGGLQAHGLVTEAHNRMYKFQRSKPNFVKGMKGKC